MTVISFTPSPTAAPPFTALVTLDGQPYNLTCTWNFYRGDWYYTLTDQSGNVLVNQPLIGSPPNADIFLAAGLFTTSTLLYRLSTNAFEIGP